MFGVDNYAAVRRCVFIDGHSRREAARVFGLSRETVLKMCRFSLPPGYTRTAPVAKPKLGRLLPVIDTILDADRIAPVKQRHTAKRIFDRLRDEHGFAGGYTVVKLVALRVGDQRVLRLIRKWLTAGVVGEDGVRQPATKVLYFFIGSLSSNRKPPRVLLLSRIEP